MLPYFYDVMIKLKILRITALVVDSAPERRLTYQYAVVLVCVMRSTMQQNSPAFYRVFLRNSFL